MAATSPAWIRRMVSPKPASTWKPIILSDLSTVTLPRLNSPWLLLISKFCSWLAFDIGWLKLAVKYASAMALKTKPSYFGGGAGGVASAGLAASAGAVCAGAAGAWSSGWGLSAAHAVKDRARRHK